jgi:ubiquinone/menaquinone biosynthesis C-methylase UbiE
MASEKRFKGIITDEYDLLSNVMPHFLAMQEQVGTEISQLKRSKKQPTLPVLDLGCGDGLTTMGILAQQEDVFVVALDNEAKMIARARKKLAPYLKAGRCKLVKADMLTYLKKQPAGSFAAVASAMTLHNLDQSYRKQVHHQVFRVLEPRGLFVNADKVAPQDDQQRFQALDLALERFFDTMVPKRKYKLLQDWVLHNVADQSPLRVMKERDTVRALRDLGFTGVKVKNRQNMEAVLMARKPGKR